MDLFRPVAVLSCRPPRQFTHVSPLAATLHTLGLLLGTHLPYLPPSLFSFPLSSSLPISPPSLGCAPGLSFFRVARPSSFPFHLDPRDPYSLFSYSSAPPPPISFPVAPSRFPASALYLGPHRFGSAPLSVLAATFHSCTLTACHRSTPFLFLSRPPPASPFLNSWTGHHVSPLVLFF